MLFMALLLLEKHDDDMDDMPDEVVDEAELKYDVLPDLLISLFNLFVFFLILINLNEKKN